MFGIAERNKFKTLAIGGTNDHVHLLISLPSTMPISKAVQLMKGGSSKWLHETFPELWSFNWQVKYAAFGVSVSLLEKTEHYICNQEAHHRKMTFEQEFVRMLEKHRIAYDARYLWQ